MRQVKYLSYSSFTLFEKSPAEFYVKYLAEVRLPREPQNKYMAVGSSFDAYAKAYLHKKFISKPDPQFEFEKLFETQVEAHNRSFARADGLEVWNAYQKNGGLKDLLEDMNGCIGEPRLESTIEGDIGDGIIVLGKPDVHFMNREAVPVTHDFKVNGFYGKVAAKPKTGYLKLFPGMKMHRDASPQRHRGILVNASKPLNMSAPDWAEQLTMYAWVMGAKVGSDYVLTIDQLCCDPINRQHMTAKHSALCTTEWQLKLYERLKRAWNAIKSGHIFLDLPYEENLAKIKQLNMEVNDIKDRDPVFDAVNGQQRIR